jgi:hypothetical protein
MFSLCNVGFGLIPATIAKSSNAAIGIAFICIPPQMFPRTFVGAVLFDLIITSFSSMTALTLSIPMFRKYKKLKEIPKIKAIKIDTKTQLEKTQPSQHNKNILDPK